MRKASLMLLAVATGAALLLFSCKSRHRSEKRPATGMFSSGKFDADEAGDVLEQQLHVTDSSRFSLNARVYALYKTNDFLPVWLNEDGTAPAAEAFLADLDSLRWDGLDPERYRLSSLKDLLNGFKKEKTLSTDQVIRLDTTLSASYLRASRDLLMGMVVPRTVDSLWFHANDSAWHTEGAANLLKDGTYYPLDSFKSKLPTYALVKAAYRHYRGLPSDSNYSRLHQQAATPGHRPGDSVLLALIHTEVPWLEKLENDTLQSETASWIFAYQQYYGLKRTGKTDSATIAVLSRDPQQDADVLQANLERLRWLPRNFDSLYVLVNIPTMELMLRKEGFDAMRMNVVVGKPIRQTPALNATMANIVFNPPWGVPPTILKKDVLPGMTKSGTAYLRQKGLKVYDHKGNAVDASAVNASNYKKFVFRQPPGDDNALGYVKFNLPNKWDIYLHDTPHRDDFDKWDRARSSGCIRLSRPKELAEYILTDLEHRRYDLPRIDSVIQTQKTRWEILKTKIPVHIVYLTAIENSTGTGIRFGRDFYGRDKRLMAALSQ